MAIVTPMAAPPTEISVKTIESSQQTTQGPESHVQTDQKPQASQDELSSQFASLARREKMMREYARRIQEEKQGFKEREAEIASSIHSEWKSKLSQNPWDTLIEAGLTPDQVTHALLNQPKPEQIEMRNLKKELEEIKNSQNQTLQDFKQSERDQAKRQMTATLNQLIKREPDQYEGIKHYGDYATSETINLIEAVFDHGIPGVYDRGYVMSVEDAAQEVEKYLIDQSMSVTNLKKIQSRLYPGSPNQLQNLSKQEPQQKPLLNTLSNRMTPTTRPLTDKERRERAILAFQGKI